LERGDNDTGTGANTAPVAHPWLHRPRGDDEATRRHYARMAAQRAEVAAMARRYANGELPDRRRK
jgi:hypothetical protein